MDVDPRELRQLVDTFLTARKDRDFTARQIAAEIGAPYPEAITAALESVIRCPFTSCQSFDTGLSKQENNGFEIHHCNRCDRNFHVQREGTGYSILGWYGE